MAERSPRGAGALLPDAATALAAAVVAGFALPWLGAPLSADLANPQASNVWFDADLPYRLEVMIAGGGWATGGAHPLFPGVAHLMLAVATRLVHAGDAWTNARAAAGMTGGVWLALTYVLLRVLRLERVDALLFTAIGFVSAGSLFWFTVPESFGLSAVGTTLALLAAACAGPPLLLLAAACAASGAFVLSSSLVGAMAVLGHNRAPREWPRALSIGLAAFGLLAGAWALQEWSRPTPFFLGERLREYDQHLFPVTPGRMAEIVPGLLVDPVVAPELRNETPSFRKHALRPAGPAGVVAMGAWVLLLLAGAVALVREALRGRLRPFAVAAFGGTAALVAVHSSLGREMFLYALNLLPLLLSIAALAVRFERARPLVRTCAVVLLLAAAFNNSSQFTRAEDAARVLAARRVAPPAAP